MLPFDSLKKRIFAITTAALLIVSISAVSMSLNQVISAVGEKQSTKRTLNVSGQGVVKVSSDIAFVTLGVISEDVNAKVAQQNNAKAMSDAVTAIKLAGVKTEDIKTTSYSINPKYDYNKDTGASKIIGYSVQNQITVTVRDITKVGNIIDLASDSGLNLSSNISFYISDYEKYYNEALKNAVNIAKKRAETIAGVLGFSLKVPVSVTENSIAVPPMINYGSYDMKSTASVSTPIEAGTFEINASVSMTFQY